MTGPPTFQTFLVELNNGILVAGPPDFSTSGLENMRFFPDFSWTRQECLTKSC